jgi:Ca2+-binding RTX toxin-like protein
VPQCFTRLKRNSGEGEDLTRSVFEPAALITRGIEKEKKIVLRKTMTLATVVLAAGMVIPAYPAEAAPTCFGNRATIVGTNRDKTKVVELRGTPGNDVIVGLGGIDLIDARGGDDLICAGGGDDFIKAGPGDDKVMGQDAIDDIWGGGGHDRIWGGRGPAESLFGGRGNDRLFGGPGTEDYLFGGPGDDVMDGGRGEDLAMYPESPRGVEADLRTGIVTGHGRDRVVSIETVYGSAFDDVLYGDDDANTLAGGPGDDRLYGLGGNDRLRSGWGGDDLLDGGEGLDTANYFLSWDPVQVDLAAGRAVTSGVDTLVGITNLVGSKYDDTLIGNGEDNLIFGSRGNDVMNGGGGTDEAAFFDSYEVVVDLDEGTATEERFSDTLANFENIIGSAFADTIIGDDGPNAIWGGSGADTLVGAGGDDMLIGQRGNDSVDGGDGTDTCDGETEINCELAPAAASYSGDRRELAVWGRVDQASW